MCSQSTLKMSVVLDRFAGFPFCTFSALTQCRGKGLFFRRVQNTNRVQYKTAVLILDGLVWKILVICSEQIWEAFCKTEMSCSEFQCDCVTSDAFPSGIAEAVNGFSHDVSRSNLMTKAGVPHLDGSRRICPRTCCSFGCQLLTAWQSFICS